MHIHIHAPQPDARCIVAHHCPDCKMHSWFIAFHTEWYGWDKTCLRCGREWSDGGWEALPFVRGARKKNIDAAKKRWRENPGLQVMGTAWKLPARSP